MCGYQFVMGLQVYSIEPGERRSNTPQYRTSEVHNLNERDQIDGNKVESREKQSGEKQSREKQSGEKQSREKQSGEKHLANLHQHEQLFGKRI
jgi:hypothetical protein